MKTMIAFYEGTQLEKNRIIFQEYVRGLNIPLYHNWDDLGHIIPTILFFHGGDKADLTIRTDFGSSLRPELYNTWLVEFGGFMSEKKNEGEKVISYIKYTELQDRLTKIIDEIMKLPKITKEGLEEIIFAVDTKLETLLAPFATHRPNDSNLPIAKDSNGNKLVKNRKVLNIKDALSDYLRDKIAKGL